HRHPQETKTLDTLHTIISCKNFHHPQTKQCEIWNVEFIPQNPSSDEAQVPLFCNCLDFYHSDFSLS
ncbi:hypothetical protein, partial [Fibrobacter sp.]|uniref:hypothetical protein n=1 Tax=Fibrobacter sp. TaxID=35828 RepID=UPI00388D8163